jgi:hypothetical protein
MSVVHHAIPHNPIFSPAFISLFNELKVEGIRNEINFEIDTEDLEAYRP